MERQHIVSRGAKIVFRVVGRGEPLVMIHGNGEDHACFAKQIGDFSRKFTLILPDSRGHGESEHKAVSLGAIARDVLAILDFLKIKRANALGFSDGANIAILMALTAPERIDRLVLAGGNLDPAGVKASCQIPTVLGYGLCRFSALFSENAKKKADILRLMVKEPHIDPRELSKITSPALVLAGENDLIKQRHTELIAHSLKNSKLVVIPKSDHFIFDKAPGDVNKAALDFLTDRQNDRG